jgi:hypothetical protein
MPGASYAQGVIIIRERGFNTHFNTSVGLTTNTNAGVSSFQMLVYVHFTIIALSCIFHRDWHIISHLCHPFGSSESKPLSSL